MNSPPYNKLTQFLRCAYLRTRFGLVWWLRGVGENDLDAFYEIPDAHGLGRWNSDRFEALVSVIRTHIGPVDRVVDVGCHEGRCLRYLMEHVEARGFVGLDVSRQALDRARQRCAGLPGEFYRFDLNQLYTDPEETVLPFQQTPDVLVACEVVYYVGPASYRRWRSSRIDFEGKKRFVLSLARLARKAVIFQHFGKREREAIAEVVRACGGRMVNREWGIYLLTRDASAS